MAKYLHEFPKNLTEYPNSFKRQGAFPLEMYSVFTSLEAAKAYAEDPNSVAYVGQPIAVTKQIEGEVFYNAIIASSQCGTYFDTIARFSITNGIVTLHSSEQYAQDVTYSIISGDPSKKENITIKLTGHCPTFDDQASPYIEEIQELYYVPKEDIEEELDRYVNDATAPPPSSRYGTTLGVIDIATTYYVIGNTKGDLIELGTAENVDDLNTRLSEVEKFFEATDNLNETIDTLYELQEFIKEHGEDFSALHGDVKDIYTPSTPGDPVTGKPEIPESGVLVDKEAQLRSEIQNIYKAGVGENPPTGKLPDETAARIAADEALGKRIDEIYDDDGGLAEDGITKIPSGLLVREAEAREAADAKIYEDLLGSDPREEETEFNGVTGILAGIRGRKDADGKYQYNNIIEYIQNEIPIATENRLGRVLSSKEKDQVAVGADGTMTVNSLNVNKLYQTEYLIIDGGTATPVAFTPKEEEPTIEEV